MKQLARIPILILTVLLCSIVNIYAQNNLEKTLIKAKQENKHILINFSGSDWCRSCILLKRTILDTKEFKQFVDKEIIILDVDFPRSKKNRLPKEQVEINETLAAKYNPKGIFPTIIIMDNNCKVLGKTGYKRIKPSDYIKHIQSFINKQ